MLAFIPPQRFFLFLSVFIFLGLMGFTSFAQTKPAAVLTKPEGQVILTISGEIENGTSGDIAEFDLDTLKQLGTLDIETETPWTEGKIRFTGVLARDVMDLVGATGRSISAIALNDYSVSIPFEDFDKYDVIIATERDGAPMRIRDRGPLWVIYPWSDNAELRNELYYSRSIWQLRSIEVVN